jgi:hypothetical protein
MSIGSEFKDEEYQTLRNNNAAQQAHIILLKEEVSRVTKRLLEAGATNYQVTCTYIDQIHRFRKLLASYRNIAYLSAALLVVTGFFNITYYIINNREKNALRKQIMDNEIQYKQTINKLKNHEI